MNVRNAAITAGLVLLAVTTTAHADVDAEIVGNAKISGTLAPEGEVETLRFDATAGSTLTLGIAAKKKAPLDFTLTLYAPDDSVVSFDDAAKVIDKDKKVMVKKLPLAQTGSYRLEVTATGIGEYALKVKATPAKKLSRTVALDAGTAGEAAFAAPAGSTLTIRATAPKGDASLPRIDAVAGMDVSALASPKGNKHTVKVLLGPDDGGDLTIALTNTAAGDGTVALQVTIQPPKVKATKLDFRGVSRGAPSGGETVVVRAVGVAGGQVGIDDEASRIDGVRITVPAGALVSSAAISISTADPIAAPGNGNQSAGEAVEFGPDGLQFATSATVVLPFDPSALPIGTDPENDILVVRETSDGETEVIRPTSVDVEAGTVTVPVSGFSTFMTFVPAGSPNLDGNEYWYLGFSVGLSPSTESDGDSRARDLDVTIGSMSFGTIGTEGDFNLDAEFRDITWTHDQDGTGSIPISETGDDLASGSWSYLPDGRTVLVQTGEDAGELVASEDGSYLLGGTFQDNGEGDVAFDLAVRKQFGNTLASLAGSYTMGGGDVFASGPEGFGPRAVSISRVLGTLTVRADGTWTLSASENLTDFYDGRFENERESYRIAGTARIGGTLDGRFEDTLILEVEPGPDDEPATFVALPGTGGVLVGTDLVPFDDGHFFFFAVRQTTGVSKATLDGRYDTLSLEIETTTYVTIAQSSESVLIGDVAVCAYGTTLILDGNGRATELGYEGVCHTRDEGETDGVRTEESSGADDEDSFSVKVAANGKITVPGGQPEFGATTPDGQLFFTLRDPKASSRPLEVVLGVRPPVIVD